MRLAEIHVYPIKGAHGIALSRADVLTGGLRHDRRFMLVDDEGTFLTQRDHPRLALVTTALASGTLAIDAGDARVVVPLAPSGGPPRRVRIWRDEVEALEVEGDAAGLLSSFLGRRCALVFMPDSVVRPVNPKYAAPGDRVGFADGYPLLLAARASLEDLNARLATPLPMDRFRPNLVVEGGAAFEEDRHERAVIGGVAFRMPKRCNRCQVTTIDQATAEVGVEPLRTLARYREVDNNVYFAQNMIPDAEGEVRIGDAVVYV